MDSSNAERLARLEEQIKNHDHLIDALQGAIAKCVTLERFRVVEIIALGLAGLVLVPVVSLLVSRVLSH